ncbi:MAG: hypothetical protein ACOY71_14520 [Gemmatimonadota bacterium]
MHTHVLSALLFTLAQLPPGWTGRTDGKGSLADVNVRAMGSGYHVTTGPAVILYRAADKADGPFHTLATFTLSRQPTHPEAYGLFVGGRGLDGAGQRYIYFLIRGDGSFLVKRREGDRTTNVTPRWAVNPAVARPDAKGRTTNTLEIDARSDPARVNFVVNGKVVHSASAKDLDLTGIVGLRVNHNLDVHVAGFALHQ